MSYEQVSKDLEKVIGYIHSDELQNLLIPIYDI